MPERGSLDIMALSHRSPAVAASVPLRSTVSRPSRPIRWLLYAIGSGVWLSGVLWWVFDRYLLQQTVYGIAQHPLQVWWLRLHAATATAAIWLLGYLSAMHVQRNWAARLRRNSGLLFVSAVGLLAVSGYLLYYVEADRPLAVIADVHWAVGLCAPVAFLLHRGLRRARRAAVAPSVSPPLG